LLEVKHITKKFQGVTALSDVSLQLHPGKVTAIIGENGAGKSTLMKILSGVYTDYEGSLALDGLPLHLLGVKDAQEKGIAIIHQELNLLTELSIADNIFLGRELVDYWGMLSKRKMDVATANLLAKVNLRVPPHQLVGSLKVGEQQLVEIAKALLTDAKVIIMDEPTSAISEQEVLALFAIIRQLRAANKIIVYISHKLDELFKIADNYTVIRDGQIIGEGVMHDVNQDDLIHQMVGRSIEMVRQNTPASTAEEVVLSVKNLSLASRTVKLAFAFQDIHFHLKKGEILGIFGLMGAGRTALLETIAGCYPNRTKGSIVLHNKKINIRSTYHAMQAGIALVPEDRKKDGLFLDLEVRKNISITTLEQIEHNGLLDAEEEKKQVALYVEKLNIKISSDQQLVGELSGGNQQKIVLSKNIAIHPTVLLLDEPTRGIDVSAKQELYRFIARLADEGMSIIFVSSELPEILSLSHRILVMAEGKITQQFQASDASEALILKAALPTKQIQDEQ
jgi:ribose transport system ATP-binding protein